MTDADQQLKLAVLSHILPPSPSGQANILYRLLKEFKPDQYCLLSRSNYDEFASPHQTSAIQASSNQPLRLSARYYHLPLGFQVRGLAWLGFESIARKINLSLQIRHRAKCIARIVKSERCTAILACTGDLADLPAAHLAARWLQVPLYTYLFDDYLYQWSEPWQREFARRVEPIIMKNADGIIVPNEFLQEEYRRRYSIDCTVIRNPCDVIGLDETLARWPAHQGEIRIVYTGAIYHAHFDAFRNLIAAIQQLGRADTRLHLYTAQPREDLEREQIKGPVEYHNHMAQSAIIEIQQQADILFLPLAFNSPIPEIVRTSAPGKMGEYLASGRPILVHAPAQSFVTWYFKRWQSGVVADHDEPAKLAQAIERVINDADLRQTVAANAHERALADFSLSAAQGRFLNLFAAETRR